MKTLSSSYPGNYHVQLLDESSPAVKSLWSRVKQIPWSQSPSYQRPLCRGVMREGLRATSINWTLHLWGHRVFIILGHLQPQVRCWSSVNQRRKRQAGIRTTGAKQGTIYSRNASLLHFACGLLNGSKEHISSSLAHNIIRRTSEAISAGWGVI